MKKRKELLFAAALLLTAALLLNFASDVLRPVRLDYGSTWSAFRAEPRDSLDVLYLGSSYAYCDINPSLIYAQTGLTGFVLAGSEQPLSITYWYLREALRTQSPRAVLIEGTSLFFDTYQNYTQINVGYMPFSLNKLGAIFTASEPELRPGLLFDLYFYHTRWKEVGLSDIQRALTPAQPDHYKGYTAIDQVQEGVGIAPYVGDRKVDPQVYAENLEWLDKILALCEENGIQPIVAFHPTYTRCTRETYARIEAEVRALDPDALFYNWSEEFESIGLTPTTDLYDGGHLNQDGAAVFSPWLGDLLVGEAGLTPRPQSENNAAAWTESAARWREYLAG